MRMLLRWIIIPLMTVGLAVGELHADFQGIWTGKLANGMNLVVVEDHSAPLVASVVCVRAGSHTETPSTSGLSHLLEHLLFDGTTSRSREELERSITGNGGYFNAFTRKDYVCFEVVMPTVSAELGFEIQADQLLHSIIPEKELVKERKVVCEEIAKDIDSASSLADEHLMRRLFGDSGYALPVIGSYRTVQSIPREAILGFYRSRYVPDRMTAVVVGDVNATDVQTAFERLYGTASPGLSPQGLRVQPVVPDASVMIIDRQPVDASVYMMAVPIPDLTETDQAALEMAVSMWSESDTSPLQAALTTSDPPLAASVSAWLSRHHDFSLLYITAMPLKDKGDEDDAAWASGMRTTILASIRQFLERGVPKEKLQALVMSRTVDHVFSREKFHHFARDIAHYDALGTPEVHFNRADILLGLTSEQVESVAGKILGAPRYVDVMVVQDPSVPRRVLDSASDFAAVESWTETSGLKVISAYDEYAPVAAVHLLIPVDPPVDAGLPRITSEMLTQGTDTRTAAEIDAFLSTHGIRIKLSDNPWMPFDDYYSSPEYNYIRMECLSSQFDAAMEILSDIAFHPVFPGEQLAQVSSELISVAAIRRNKPAAMTYDRLMESLFPGTVLAQPELPEPRQLAGIDSRTLTEFHHRSYTPDRCWLSVTGKVSPAIIRESLSRHFPVTPGVFHAVSRVTPGLPEKPASHRLDLSGDQAYLRTGVRLDPGKEDLASLQVAVEILSSRLVASIRQDLGMAYRLGAVLDLHGGGAVLHLGTGTRLQNVSTVETAIRDTVRQWQSGEFSPKEVSDSIQSLIGHELRYHQRRINRAYYLCWQDWLGNGYLYDLELIDRLNAVTPESVRRSVTQDVPGVDLWHWVIAEPSGREELEMTDHED